MTTDPYESYLLQAEDLFAQGEVIKAGQIWQAILKQRPAHAQARERLMAVKQHLLTLREAAAAPVTPVSEPVPIAEPIPVPPAPISEPVPEPEPPSPTPEPVRVITGALDPERLVAQGCTLYDMGQFEDALHKWEQVLILDPAHGLACGYANGARRELGLPPLPPAPVPQVVVQPQQAPLADEDADKLLREAVQLYDMGLVEEAIFKWERVLVLEPQRQEIQGYLRQARMEVEQEASGPAATPAHTLSRSADQDALDLKFRQAEHLLTLQRHEEAAFTFQQALGLDPGNTRALQGLERCRKPRGRGLLPADLGPAPAVSFDAQGRIAMVGEQAPTPPETQGVEPPAAVLKAATAAREGLSLPARFRAATTWMPAWLKAPRVFAGLGGGILVLVIGLSLLHGYRKDQALREEVRAARTAALAPVAQQSEARDLTESPESIRQETEAALVTDPLRAYLRAEALLARNPGDAAGAQLLEKARAGLAGGITGASLPEFQKHLQNGDLEAATQVMDALLRAQPADEDLRARAARLHLALCSAHAAQAKWDAAQADLFRGRALFPHDKTWQARLALLERVKALPKAQQAGWIPLLG